MLRKLFGLFKSSKYTDRKPSRNTTINWKPKIKKFDNLVTIGTWYGNWTIPGGFLKNGSVAYLAGAGEDISFDVGIATKFGCRVYILDPTPRAKTHFESLISCVVDNKKMPIGTKGTGNYQIKKNQLDLLKFLDIGLWSKSASLKFYSPSNPEHVSHSILNLQKQSTYFIAKVDRLSSIMKRQGHDYLDLLKIDIEGAEYKVLGSIIEDNVKIKVLCVEFDEASNPIDDNYLERIRSAVESLLDYGYEIVHVDDQHNYTFVLAS